MASVLVPLETPEVAPAVAPQPVPQTPRVTKKKRSRQVAQTPGNPEVTPTPRGCRKHHQGDPPLLDNLKGKSREIQEGGIEDSEPAPSST